MKLSARNILRGTVAGVKKGPVNTEVILELKTGLSMVSAITNTSAENLGLKQGTEAFAVVKASSVIIGTDLENARISTRNIFKCNVMEIVEGPVNSEVDLEIGPGVVIVAVITAQSVKRLGLKAGKAAYAMIKANSVMLGVE